MAKIITSGTCEDAYLLTVRHLLSQKGAVDENVMVTITNPTNFTGLNRCIKKRNPWNLDKSSSNVRHVIRTIFPYDLAEHFPGDRHRFYQEYLRIYRSGKNRKWGTYFQRFIDYSNHSRGAGVNQLEKIICALAGAATQRYYCNMHTTSVNLESNVKPLGGPCLQYVQFNKAKNGTLDMVAIYRNHDYFNKALGNFYGLGHLLNFVSTNSGINPGILTIHSIHAYSSKSQKKLKKLII